MDAIFSKPATISGTFFFVVFFLKNSVFVFEAFFEQSLVLYGYVERGQQYSCEIPANVSRNASRRHFFVSDVLFYTILPVGIDSRGSPGGFNSIVE